MRPDPVASSEAKLRLEFEDSSLFLFTDRAVHHCKLYIFFLCYKRIKSCLLLHSTLRTGREVLLQELLLQMISSLFQRDQCLPSQHLFLKRRTVL